jgi:hypothetical protein
MTNGWKHGGSAGAFFVLLVFVFAECRGLDFPVPAAPGGINVKTKSADTVIVSWTIVTGATDYEISYGTQADALTNTLLVASAAAPSPSGNTRSAEITGLTPGTTYYFSVKAGNGGGWSGASASRSAKTAPADGGLSTPQFTEAAAGSHESVSLSWETVQAKFYYLYRADGADSSEAYTLIGTPGDSSYTDMTVQPGATYYYRVSAINGDTESAKSEARSVTTPARPEDSAVPEANLSAALRWLKGNAGSDRAYAVELTADETLRPVELSYAGKTNITIAIKGGGGNRTITLEGTDSIFKIASGVTLVLGPGVTLQGDPAEKSNNRALVHVCKGGKLVMQDGAKITGNTVNFLNSQGGGVYAGGTFIMDGGEISGNTVMTGTRSAYGGGVYVHRDASFIMNGGRITGNTARSAFYSPFGGGVYISDGAAFVMNGGEISRNTVVSETSYVAYGGGVSVEGVFTMNNGKISDNNASATKSSAYGGGLYTANPFIMKGGEIRGNKVSTNAKDFISGGGGVYSAGGLLMSGGTVSGNTASSSQSAAYGGGVYMEENTDLRMDGGEISSNTVSSSSSRTLCGGGIYAGGSLYISAGKVSGNTLSSAKTSAYGGGVFVIGDFTMSGGEISANVLDTPNASPENVSCGAGVFINGLFSMNAGEIKGNKAPGGTSAVTGGGIFINDGGKFLMDGGVLSGNIANYGGGVYVYGTGALKKSSFSGFIYGSDDTSRGNSALQGDGFGHAVYVYAGEAQAEDDTNIKYRDSTANAGAGLDTGKAGASGGWQ